MDPAAVLASVFLHAVVSLLYSTCFPVTARRMDFQSTANLLWGTTFTEYSLVAESGPIRRSTGSLLLLPFYNWLIPNEGSG